MGIEPADLTNVPVPIAGPEMTRLPVPGPVVSHAGVVDRSSQGRERPEREEFPGPEPIRARGVGARVRPVGFDLRAERGQALAGILSGRVKGSGPRLK